MTWWPTRMYVVMTGKPTWWFNICQQEYWSCYQIRAHSHTVTHPFNKIGLCYIPCIPHSYQTHCIMYSQYTDTDSVTTVPQTTGVPVAEAGRSPGPRLLLTASSAPETCTHSSDAVSSLCSFIDTWNWYSILALSLSHVVRQKLAMYGQYH